MSGWICAGLVVASFAIYGAFVCWKIIRDNRPGPRWPGSP